VQQAAVDVNCRAALIERIEFFASSTVYFSFDTDRPNTIV